MQKHQQEKLKATKAVVDMRRLVPRREKVIIKTGFSGNDAEVAGFFRRSALRAELGCTSLRAAITATEAPKEICKSVTPPQPAKVSMNVARGVMCKCIGNFENYSNTIYSSEMVESAVANEESADKNEAPVSTMFGLSCSDYERALVTASARRRVKRARAAALADEVMERPAKKQRTEKASTPMKQVPAVERLLQAARSGNRHLARKVLRKISGQNDFLQTAQHALHECIIARSGAGIVSTILAECSRVVGFEATTDMVVPACRAVSNEYPVEKLGLLCDAVRHCSYDQVRAFLEFGYDADFRMVSGCTALMVSAFKNNTRMIQLLCEFGADVSATMENGVSALAVASFQGNVEATELLIERGALIDQQTADGTTALMTAVQENQVAVVNMLIESGAQINLCKPNGSSPIIVAVRHRRASMISVLGEAGGDPNLVLSNGASALVLACANGDVSCVNELIRLNADISRPLNTGATAIEYACHRGNIEIVAHLLQNMPAKLDNARLKRLSLVTESRKNVKLGTLLRIYAKTDLTNLHYAVFLDDIKTVHKTVRDSEVNFSADTRDQLLSLAEPACAAYLRRAFAPFSVDNKDLWPESFVTVADKALEEKTDIMQHVFSFCGRDWFSKK